MKTHHTHKLAPTLTITLILATTLLGGCCSSFRKPPPPPPPPDQPPATATVAVPVSGTELDPANLQKIRNGETLKAYPINRYVDPNDPNLLHEAHLIYRKETSASWNLTPRAPTAVPLGPTLAISDPALTPAPTSADIEQRMTAQTRLMAALTEQNETLVAELSRLHRDLAATRAATTAAPNATVTTAKSTSPTTTTTATTIPTSTTPTTTTQPQQP